MQIACLSDLHLGHPRNAAADIIANLRLALPDSAATGDLDIIFLAGDVFDGLLSLPDKDVLEIDLWISSLLRICQKHDIVLRVLDGTKSHDWFQSQRFMAINDLTKICADVQYIRELSIEYIERFDIHVLYVPDEWEDDTEKTLQQTHALLKAKGLAQVDYAIMHGQFEYQLPAFIKAQKHSSDAYQALVRELIFIGHVHTHTRLGRIIAQGSFDRLSHGEEGPKGHVRATIHHNGDRDVIFVENTTAKKFITVNCTELSLEDTLNAVDDQVGNLAPGSYVRVEAQYDNPVFTNMEALIRRHPFFVFSKLVRELETIPVELIEDETVFHAITITRENLPEILLERLALSGASAQVLDVAGAILLEVL